MLILLGILILLISFVIALVSMIREQRKITEGNKHHAILPGEQRHAEVENVREVIKQPPDANHLDVLKSRIEELARQEALASSVQLKEPQETLKRSNQQIDKDAFERAKLDELLNGKGEKPNQGATSGTILIADLVKEKTKREDNSS